MFTLLAISLGLASLMILLRPFLRIRANVRTNSHQIDVHPLNQTQAALFEQIDQLHKDMEMQIISKVEFSHQIVLLKEQIAINLMQLEQLKNTLSQADVPIQSSSTTERNSQP